jgi:effector-binding domain-containing protein
MALYFEDGIVEVGAEISEPFTGNERIHCSQLPGGMVATTVHMGPYGGLGEAHAAIREWNAKQGHRLSGTCWELYGHWEQSWNNDPTKIRTDVFHLLRDASV